MHRRQLRADFATLSRDDDVCRRHLLERQSHLRRRIEAWYDAAQNVIPGLATLRACPEYDTSSIPPQQLRLPLPSVTSSHTIVPRDVLSCEWRLREAQAYDALADLRAHLDVIMYLHTQGLHHVDPKTCEGLLNIVVGALQAELRIVVCRYRSAYDALERLSSVVPPKATRDWRVSLMKLHDDDIQHVTVRNVKGEPQSWIWNLGGSALLKPRYLLDIRRNNNLFQGRYFCGCFVCIHLMYAVSTTGRLVQGPCSGAQERIRV